MTNEDVLNQGGNLSIPRHVKKASKADPEGETQGLVATWASFEAGGREFWSEMDSLVEMLDGVLAEEATDV